MASVSACELIAGVEEKTQSPATTTSSSSGAGSSGAGGAGGGGVVPGMPVVGDPLCASGTMPDCVGSMCNGANLMNSPCHCGVCNRSCGGADCSGGHCMPTDLLVSASHPSVYRVATDGERLFFATHESGTDTLGRVFSMPLDGKGIDVLTLQASDPLAVRTLAVDCENIYYAQFSPIETQTVAVYSVPKDTWPSVPTELGKGLGTVTDILADGKNVYWLFGGGTDKGELWAYFKASGTAKKLLSSLRYPYGLAADDKFLFFGEMGAGPNLDQGLIERIEKPSGENATINPTILVQQAGEPYWLAADLSDVYWFDGEQKDNGMGGTTVRIQRAGKAAADQMSGNIVSEWVGSSTSYTVAVDTKNVYWVTASALMRRSKDMSEPEVELISTGTPGLNAYKASWFVQDRARLYVTATYNSNAQIFWIAK